jgi:hypothetical protein
MTLNTAEVLKAIKQMNANGGATTKIVPDVGPSRLLQAGYQFSDPSSDDDLDEVYSFKWEVLEAWFNRRRIPHAVVRISYYNPDQVVVMMLVVAEERHWSVATVAFPTLEPAPSLLRELLSEEQSEEFGYEVTFHHIDSREDEIFVDGYWMDDGREFRNAHCLVSNYLKYVAIDDYFHFFDGEKIVGDHGDFMVTAYRVDP